MCDNLKVNLRVGQKSVSVSKNFLLYVFTLVPFMDVLWLSCMVLTVLVLLRIGPSVISASVANVKDIHKSDIGLS